jgi:hypothetical protein
MKEMPPLRLCQSTPRCLEKLTWPLSALAIEVLPKRLFRFSLELTRYAHGASWSSQTLMDRSSIRPWERGVSHECASSEQGWAVHTKSAAVARFSHKVVHALTDLPQISPNLTAFRGLNPSDLARIGPG